MVGFYRVRVSRDPAATGARLRYVKMSPSDPDDRRERLEAQDGSYVFVRPVPAYGIYSGLSIADGCGCGRSHSGIDHRTAYSRFERIS
jgi:hypothetical protein